MDTMNLKRGDSFYFSIDLTNELDQPLDLPLDDIKSQVRRGNDELVDTLTIEKDLVEVGRYNIRSLDTTSYPVETLFLDIKIRDNDLVTSTKTTKLVVEKDVTKWL